MSEIVRKVDYRARDVTLCPVALIRKYWNFAVGFPSIQANRSDCWAHYKHFVYKTGEVIPYILLICSLPPGCASAERLLQRSGPDTDMVPSMHMFKATPSIMMYSHALCSRTVMPDMCSTKCTYSRPLSDCIVFFVERYVPLLWLASTRSNSFVSTV
jgi:hypothetical protein